MLYTFISLEKVHVCLQVSKIEPTRERGTCRRRGSSFILALVGVGIYMYLSIKISLYLALRNIDKCNYGLDLGGADEA